MRNGEAMNKSEPCAKWRNRVVLSILGVLLFPRGPLQAQGGVGQEVADLQKQSEAIASPIVQQQKAEQTVAAKRQSDAGGSSQSELRQEVDRALETSRRAEAEAKAKAAEKAAVEKLSAERKAIADKTAEEVKTAKEGVDKAAAELEASEKAAKTAAKLAAERRDAEKASISGAEEAEDQAERARRNVKRLAEKKAAAQKAAGEAKGDKAVLAAKTAETAVAAELTTAQAEADKAVAKAKTASDQKIAAMKARLEAERVRADVEGDVLRKRDAVKRAEDAYDLARRRNEDAVDKLEDAVRDAKSAFAEEQRRAEQKEAAAVQAERDRQREAKRLQEVKQAADQRDQEQRNRDLAKQRAQERARQLEDERNRAVAAKASAQAEKDIAGAKAGKAAADKAAVAAQARFESDKALAAKAAESSKLATAALAAAIAAEKTADEKVQKADSEQAASARSLKALSITADDAADAAADAKAELAKAVAALESAKAIVVKDPKNKAATDAKAAKVSAAEKRLADAKAAEAAAAAKLNSAGESEKAAATADAAKKTAALEARKALVSARASLDKAEDDAAAKAAAYKKAQGALADSQDDDDQAKKSAEAASRALADAEGRLAAASKTLAGDYSGRIPVKKSIVSNVSKRKSSSSPVFLPDHDDKGPIWPNVKTVRVIGDVGFASEQDLVNRVALSIVDGKQKSPDSVRKAFKSLLKELGDAGYYFASIDLGTPAYDEKTQSLNVIVDSGKLGTITVGDFCDANQKPLVRKGGDGAWYSKSQIQRRFQAFRTGSAFNYQDLFDKLVEINSSPDLTLDTHLVQRRVQEGEGEARRDVRYVDVQLTPRESIPFHAMYEINNYASSALDEWQHALTLQYINLTKADDVLTFSPSMTLNADLWSAAGSYMRPHYLGNGGATTLYGGYSELLSEEVVPRLDIEGNGWFVGLVESYKLIDNSHTLLTLSGGILYRYIEDQYTVSDIDLSLQGRNVSVLPATASLSYSDKKPNFTGGRSFATISGIYNLAASGDNEVDDLWVGAEENYLVLRLQVAHLHPIFGGLDALERPTRQWTLYARAQGQWSPDPLIPSEKLFLGGYSTVRGYSSKDIPGDNGVFGSLEVRSPIVLDMFSRLFGISNKVPADRLQFLAFLDAAYASQTDAMPGAIKNEGLVSVGLGLRLGVTSHTQFQFDYGFPLVDADSDVDNTNDNGAFYFSGQVQF